ncbi:hypothetical protein ND925_04840 [Vibrio diabolicus]|uniref:TRAFAC clade GTPase domain-containing protein n=1 Tax=Vibrio diabolicus TaxID=50719 RepID=UPI00215F3A6C|nr:hypothetical protein [Vibrio diabolicus]MCS0382105.1 hypothetical protein [Vibrio diabolicus]
MVDSDLNEIEILRPDLDDLEDSEELQPDRKEEHKALEKKRDLVGQEALSVMEATARLKEEPGKVVSFVGPVGVGKTTLISSLYDVFCKTNELRLSFGGSDTLYAFEKLCHYSRVTSRGDEISTPRTSSMSDVQFYHLSLVSSSNKMNIFLADRSGEDYSSMVDDLSLVDSFSEIGRSDLVCVLADSESLSTTATRHVARLNLQNLLTSMFESQVLGSDSNCLILLTKFDIASELGKEEQCLNEVQKVVQKLKTVTDAQIDILPVAAKALSFTTDDSNESNISKLWDKISSCSLAKKKVDVPKGNSIRSFHKMGEVYE